jgi:Ca-activated chloride channel family protein
VPLSVAVMIDSSASMVDGLPAVQGAAIRLVRGLGPGDRAQIVSFADRTRLMQDFTSDHPVLEQAIEAIHAQGQTALREALYEVLKRVAKLRRSDEQRRWAVVLLSDGEDTSSLVAEGDVLDLARRTNVTVHTIALRPRSVPREARLGVARARHLLAELARETGGDEYSLRSAADLDGTYGRIGDSLRTQYVLGYVPANTHRDGAWRRILVRLPARPGLAPRHRRGYFAASR